MLQSAPDAATDADTSSNRCLTNAVVESQFRAVKHGRLDGRLHVRPRDFVSSQLSYVLGRLKSKQMPKMKVSRKRPTELPAVEEKWKRSKRPTCYADPAAAARLVKSIHKKSVLLHVLMRKELSSDDMSRIQNSLRSQFPAVHGLQEPGLGQCVAGSSLPRFVAVGGPFVQILNIGDHWICATNNCSQVPNEVFLYDSLHGKASPSTVLQVP